MSGPIICEQRSTCDSHISHLAFFAASCFQNTKEWVGGFLAMAVLQNCSARVKFNVVTTFFTSV